MNGWRLIGVVTAAAWLSACAAAPQQSTVAGGAFVQVEPAPARAAQAETDRKIVRDEKGPVVVHMVPFRLGTSTVTVERMARRAGCASRLGASLLTEPGPVEVYRVQCEDGSQFMAQCELRQCRPMKP